MTPSHRSLSWRSSDRPRQLAATRRFAGALACGLFVACAGALTTTVRSDPSADFSKYRTFEVAGPRLETEAEAWLEHEVTRRLEARGLADVGREADLRVFVRLVRDATAPPADAGYVWWTGSPTPASAAAMPAGTLAVDLVDRAKNQLVWRGEARGAMRRGGALQRDRIRLALDGLFSGFPQRPAPG